MDAPIRREQCMLVWLRTIEGTDSADAVDDFEAVLQSIRFRDL